MLNSKTGTNAKLYLIPTFISDEISSGVLPEYVCSVVRELRHFIVEQEKTARSHLKQMGHPVPISELKLYPLNNHTEESDWKKYISVLLEGNSVGLMSEAGCPGVADPGAQIVALAHKHGIQVVPLVGPSSILLALMASGLNGQSFAFHGYLPIEKNERASAIKKFEQVSRQLKQTQIFIETPYRNQQLLEEFIRSARSDTLLSVAVDLMGNGESIRTMTVADWGLLIAGKDKAVVLGKSPAVFLLLAA